MTDIKTEVHNAFEVIKNGGIILYPTDTVWGIGCDATNSEAVKKIFVLKKRAESKSMIALVSGDKTLNFEINSAFHKTDVARSFSLFFYFFINFHKIIFKR